MKKRFWKRILSAFTAVTMTASTFAAFSLPARAAEESADFKVSVAAQLRASDTAFETINAGSTKFVTDSADIEMTRKSEVYFGAFYQFAPITVPDGKAVKSVIMTINRGANFTGEYYDVYKVDNPSDNTDISQVFALAAPALAGTSGNYIGKTADGTAPEGTDYGTITVDITDGFNADTANSYFIQRDENDTNKKPIRADAAITVEYSDIVSSGSVVTASTAAQLRASDDEWSTINSGSSKFVTGTENIETTVTNRFGAFYNFNRIPLPSGVKVTKATLSVYQGATKFSGKHFVVLHTDNPLELTNINSVFAIVKPAKDSISTIRVGGASAVTAMKELKDADSSRIEYIDITEYFNSDSRNSYFLYNSDSADTGNRQLSARAEIELEYVLPVAQIEDTYYYSFSDALSAASDGDTITLLKDTSIGFTPITANNLTINGGGNTITISNGQYDSLELQNSQITINNLIVEGNKVNIPGSRKIYANNCDFESLNIGGNWGADKGTIINSTIGTLSTYGVINLEKTSVTNVVFGDIKSSGSDQPKVVGDATSSVSGTVSFGSGVAVANITFPYTLFSGEMTKPAITLTDTVFASGYSYSNGVISAKTALTSVTLDKKTGIKTGDTLTAAVLPEGASVDYTWERSTDGENWSSISGETTYSYTLTSDDYDNYIKVTATGKDSYGGTVSDLTTDKVSKIQDTYTVTFKDGDGNTLDTVTVNDGDAAPAYSGATPTKTSTAQYSYTFNNTWTPALEGTITSNTTFTANFDQTARTYTITYNMQGHGTAPTDTSYTYGAEKSLPTPVADGYTFDGWYKTYNSETETYSDEVTGITATDYGNLELYAKWTEISAVTYAAQIGGTKYETFKDAIAAVTEGQTIELLDDVTLDRMIFNTTAYSASSNQQCNINNVTIDGGGKYSITSDGNQNFLFELNAGKTLTFKDITLIGGKLYTVNLKGGATTKLHLINTTITPASGKAGVSFDASGVMLYADAQSRINGIRLRSSVTWDNGTVIVNKEADSDNLATDIAGDILETEGKALYVNYQGNLLLKTAGEDDPQPTYYNIEARSGITVDEKAVPGTVVTISAVDIVANSLLVKNVANNSVVEITDKGSGEYTFVMPESDVSITGLVNTENRIYVVPTSVTAINSTGETANNYYIKGDHALGMTFEIPTLPTGKTIDSVSLHFTRQNYAGGQTTNIYDQTSGFVYKDDSGYIAQYSGNTIAAQKLSSTPVAGAYKLLLAYDSSVNSEAAGNDYYVVGAGNTNCLPRDTSQLPYLIIDFEKELPPAPEKKAPSYELQTDTLNNTFQYHFAGGTTAYNNGEDETGKAYDVYLWVPNNVAPGELKGLVAIKMNLVEIPFAYSQHLRDVLTEKGFGILFLVCQKDPYKYNNTLNGFYTKNDYKGDPITYTDSYKATYTTDGKDAADIMNELLAGIAEASGYTEIKDKTPLITIGHSAASGFGNKSANWNKDRVIAQIHMKNGMSGGEAMVPGVPQLQYAAQYTEHAMGAGRDRSVDDARYHITNKRAVSSDYLVSHIIEWGSGHYDWSENATYMLTKYITKAIDARVPANYSETGVLNDLTGAGYIMKPFEKDENGEEQAVGYYRDYLQGWLSDGKANSGASETDKKASFWFFDEEFAKEVNEFTNYAIPESPSSNLTGISGKTYSDIEPFMLMKNPSESTYATTPVTANTVIKPYTTFASNPFSRYGSVRFINYTKLAAPNGNASNTANLQGYGAFTVDTYYMNKIPQITAGKDNTAAYDGAGENANVPENTKAEFLPLIAPYEFVSSEQIDMDGMTKTGDESENVASVTRTTLRFHNDRVYFRSGNAETLKQQYPNHTINTDFGTMDMFGVIKSPEIRGNDGFVTSTFKVTSAQMNVPYVTTGKGTNQTLTLDEIDDVNVNGATENPKFAVTYTSNDEDLQKFTDVMVEYGPARAVRSGNDTDGYTWEIEVLLDQIPNDATYPIEVNVVASNLGKWEKVSGATDSKTFDIVWEKPELTGVTVTPYEAAYDAQSHNAVTVAGTVAGDTITCTLDSGSEQNTVPQITDVKDYTVKVKVEREGYKPYETTVTAKITKADMTGVTIEGFAGIADGQPHGVTISGNEQGDTVTYTYDDQTDTAVAPTYTEIGTHEIAVKIHRNENYNDLEKTVTVQITDKPVIDYITVTPNSGTYTGESVEAVTVTGATSNDTVTYKLDDGEFTSEVPKITEAGEYEVSVKVTRDGYSDFVKVVTVTISEPRDNFDTDFTPTEINGVKEYGDTTPLNGWFSNDEEDNDTAVNSVKTGDGQLIMTNGGEGANLWIGKRYATQEEAEEAAKIILKFRYTPGSTESRIYLASASAADVTAGLDSDTVEGAYKTAAELGMKANKTYDVVVTIDNSKHEAVFAVTENNSISLAAYVDLKADVPDDTNTVIFRPAAGATDKLDYFSAELLSEAKPALKIGEITQSEDKTTIAVSIENPTEETDAGIMIAALYSLDGALKEIKTDVNGTVEFNKATEGYVKLFIWTALSGEGTMEPILPSREKAISTN